MVLSNELTKVELPPGKIWKSKTNPFRHAARLIIAKSHRIICAVFAVCDYILQTPDSDPNSFPFQFKDGLSLSRHSLASNLHALHAFVHLCGLHSNDYNTHSFCIGAATMTVASGVPSWLIKILGHWCSDSCKRYIHLPAATLLQVPSSMAGDHTPTHNL